MNKSKLLLTIRKLSDTELQRFLAYVHSPFFHQHQATIALVEYLCRHLQQPEQLQKERAFAALFPGEKVQVAKLRNLMSYAMELLDGFLAQVAFEKRNTPWVYNLQAGIERDLSTQITRNFKKAQKQVRKSPYRDTIYYWQQYKLYHHQDQQHNLHVDPLDSSYLEESIRALDHFYLIEMLQLHAELLARQNVRRETLDLTALERLLHRIEKNWENYQQVPAVRIYYHVIKLALERRAQDYRALQELLDLHHTNFEQSELVQLYVSTINFAIYQYGIGRSEYLEDIFQLYNKMIQQGVFLHHGLLNETSYSNVISIACKLRQFDWATDFADHFQQYLPVEVSQNAYAYGQAVICYYQQAYDQASSLLLQVRFTNQFYQMNTRLMLAKIYYEQEKSQLLGPFLDSFRLFLKRGKGLPAHHQQTCRKFVKALQGLAHLRGNRRWLSATEFDERLHNFRSKIEAQRQAITNDEWLLEQVDRLANKA
ncbi:MAG: hypothetical protein KDC44_19155 [Phaeodactylibacter sp.]|nr:hypothetical protein [Phaeodactylibacter sp.]